MTISKKKNSNIIEVGARPFGNPDIKPDIKVGDYVFVNWSNQEVYTGKIVEKLRKNWGVLIDDSKWQYKHNLTSVTSHALIPNNFPSAKELN